MIMFTTDLLHRIYLTVLLSLFIQLIGNVDHVSLASTMKEPLTTTISPLLNGSTILSKVNGSKDQDFPRLARQPLMTTGESEQDDYQDHAQVSPNSRSLLFGRPLLSFSHRRPTISQAWDEDERGMSTRVSSSAFTVKPIALDTETNSAYINTKPLSFTVSKKVQTGHGQQQQPMLSALFGNRKGEAAPTYECIFSTSKNCLEDEPKPGNGFKSYYNSIFNKYPSIGSTDAFSSVPFTVKGNGNDRNPTKNVRFSNPRHPTPSPTWIKLEPVSASNSYDPFSVNKRNGLNKDDSAVSSATSTSQFANRVGEELNPESFAKRYGWNDHGGTNKYGGARLPSWLEELNYQQGTSPILDEIQEESSKRWVKLDPVSVSGVTISKWVPKGTSPSQLPSTNVWPIRGGGGNGGGGGGGGSSSSDWWDRVDTEPALPPKRQQPFQPRPDHFGWSSETSNGGSGWGIRYPQQQQQQQQPPSSNKRRPGSGIQQAWNDIIYPDGPTSATASWEADKHVNSQYPPLSSSQSSSSSSSSWSTHPNKRPVASWSAPGHSGNNIRIESNNNYHNNPNRRYGTGGNYNRPSTGGNSGRPHFYPDPASQREDPRWVLVSSTSNVDNVEGGSNSNSNNNQNKYYGDSGGSNSNNNERYSSNNNDFPYEYYGNTHRHSKALNLSSLSLDEPEMTSYSFKPLSQDELFRRTNAALHSLEPTLKHHKKNTPTTSKPKRAAVVPEVSDLDLQLASSVLEDDDDGDNDLLLSSTETQVVGDGRATLSAGLSSIQEENNEEEDPVHSVVIANHSPKKGFLAGLNPIYTAVGAGMIPATLAAILPMALGRKRRKRSDNSQVVFLQEPVLPVLSQNNAKFSSLLLPVALSSSKYAPDKFKLNYKNRNKKTSYKNKARFS